MPSARDKTETWLKGAEARRRLKATQATIYRLAIQGEVRFRNEPGVPTLFHAGDVAKIAEARRESAS
jgi:hypothetical protein